MDILKIEYIGKTRARVSWNDETAYYYVNLSKDGEPENIIHKCPNDNAIKTIKLKGDAKANAATMEKVRAFLAENV